MNKTEEFTVIPLRDVIVLPYITIPIMVGRSRSIKALEIAKNNNHGYLFLTLQNVPKTDSPIQEELREYGVVARIVSSNELPEKTIKVFVEGIYRAKMKSLRLEDDCYFAEVERVVEEDPEENELLIHLENLKNKFSEYVGHIRRVEPDILQKINEITIPDKLVYMLSTKVDFKATELQGLLEADGTIERIEKLAEMIQLKIEYLKIDDKINVKVKAKMTQNQKEYYLNEKMKAIQNEMGKEDDFKADLDEIEQKLKELNLPEAVQEKCNRELKKMKLMSPLSAETSVVRNYLDWMVALPWNSKTEDSLDIKNAEEILNRDHFGLEKPKERILEFLAVRKISENMKGSIICFLGPPGVGKTSLAKSIANAMGRKFVRISMGGVRDEAEIRGHRKTYIGALPGKIIQSMKKAGSINPVFLLDEIDKIGTDYRGDPASALLEALDPEQNSTFVDHYIETEFDLSKVFFITTANSIENIPVPLLDRMELISLSGYTEVEKLHIAKDFLIPKELKEHNVPEGKVSITDDAIVELITYYTKEAGVRNLERSIASAIRKSVKRIISDETIEHIEVNSELIKEYMGPRKFRIGGVYDDEEIGVATGLAWTQYGGDLLQIEVALFQGTGKLIVTGHLGDVMKESANIAFSVVKSVASNAGIPAYKFKEFDIHLHVPEGAVPKDGPSAGITMATAILSAVSETPANCRIAMTGEITLRGKVLQIGGLKEKVLAAHRAGLRTVICPIENEKDLTEIPMDVRNEMEFKLVSTFDEVRELVLKK